jgi:hypothetical protein
MPFAGPINAPGALNLIAAVKVRFMEAYDDLYSGPPLILIFLALRLM